MRCALVYCLVVDLTISVLVSVGLLFHDVELHLTYDFSSCFFPKFQVSHFQKSDIIGTQ